MGGSRSSCRRHRCGAHGSWAWWRGEKLVREITVPNFRIGIRSEMLADGRIVAPNIVEVMQDARDRGLVD